MLEFSRSIRWKALHVYLSLITTLPQSQSSRHEGILPVLNTYWACSHLRLSALAVLPIRNILSLNIQRLVSSLPGNYCLNAIVSLRLSLTFLFNSNYPTGRNVLAPPACFIFLPSCVLLSLTCLIIIPCGILGVFSFSLHWEVSSRRDFS